MAALPPFGSPPPPPPPPPAPLALATHSDLNAQRCCSAFFENTCTYACRAGRHPQAKAAAAKPAAKAHAAAVSKSRSALGPATNSGGGGNGKTIEDIYQKKTQLEHILLRPDTYIGSTEKQQQQVPACRLHRLQLPLRPQCKGCSALRCQKTRQQSLTLVDWQHAAMYLCSL